MSFSRAVARNCSAASAGVLGSMAIVSTPVAVYHSGDSWSIDPARAASSAPASSSAQ